MSKNITIKDLLARKEQLKKKKELTANLYVRSLDGEITIKEPSGEFCAEAMEMAQTDNVRSDKHVVYNCVIEPNLKDKELQEAYGCVEPYDIVDSLFKAGEVAMISGYCLDLAGWGDSVKKVDKEIKNSLVVM